jgi:5-methylcytosine-specific restriction protein B
VYKRQIFKYDVVVSAAYHLKREEVLKTKKEDLVNHILHIFELLYPFLLLAISKNPMPAIRKYLSLPKENILVKVAEKTGIKTNDLNFWIQSLNRKGQIILYGPPGTGKTFIAEKLAEYLIVDSDSFSELVQFHPAYSYEDFIQGIRPQNKDGQLTYSMVPGRFLEFCKKAESRVGICVLIIDEINRANLAQVFGELMYLLEYRDKEIPLAGGNTFRIPSNVRIIGTMNTVDRSIALVDHALRRRFAFIEIRPNYDVLRNYHEKRNTGFAVDGLIQILQKLNQAIADKNYELGISFFLTEKLAEDIEDIWKMEIEPYLEEYFFDRLEKVDEFRWDKIKQQVLP